ncbi:MAG: N-acetylmuramoyl-L-alanine amidase [Acidimicrobiaceae bacterium]
MPPRLSNVWAFSRAQRAESPKRRWSKPRLGNVWAFSRAQRAESPKRRWSKPAVALLVVLCACSSSSSPTAVPGSTASKSTTTTAEPTTTTTTAPKFLWPAVDETGPGVFVSPNGIVLPVISAGVAHTPCNNAVAPVGTPILGTNVVIDPGHGGKEPGAVGPTGLVEKDVNLDISQDVQRLLEAEGAKVVLTRPSDYYSTIQNRAEIALALHPQVFISIHHNAEPDGPSDVPGNETYYQIASPESKRLAGLLWEEVSAAFAPHKIAWAADTDHGAKFRPSASGGDYYGILRRGAGITTVLSEAAFISNPPEEQLLRDPAFKHAEAVAIANAITRFLATPDPGSGFVEPYPRTEPAGGGGGPEGCTDPTL